MAWRAESVLGMIVYNSIATLKLAIQGSLPLPTTMASALIFGKDVDDSDAQSSKPQCYNLAGPSYPQLH